MAALLTALQEEHGEETVVMWDSMEDMAAVDFDAAEGYEYDDAKLLVLLESFSPAPSVAWVTHGGGLRMVYEKTEEFTAEEIAAVALLNLSHKSPYVGLEIKSDTRHPKSPDSRGRLCGIVVQKQQEFNARSLRRWLRVYDVADEEVQHWLDERGLERGCRYDHSQCPIAPSDKGGRQPVVVGDMGIHCFVCEAAGTCAGSTKPGFFPYAHVCDVPRATSLYRCIKHGVHWDHAQFIVDSALRLQPRHAQLVYAAGVALTRGRDDAKRCFAVGKDLVRIADRWCNLSGEPYTKDVRPILATLPVCTFVDEKGKPKVDRARVAKMEQTHDLSAIGYASLVPVFGCCMWPCTESSDEDQVRAVIQTRELMSENAASLRPRYVKVEDRMREDEMWREFERSCPGLSHPYLMLLVAARAVAESMSSRPPMTFVTGPTGASKTLSVFLAAAVCGDRNTEIPWVADAVRLRQAIIEGASVGTYVTFNEVLKEARRQVKTSSQAMDYVLNLTPDSSSHVMYIGPVRLGRLPAFVWTDTDLPDAIKKDAQLARRLVHVQLSSQLDWDESLRDTGVGHPKWFRLSSETRAEACNALLSRVMDEFFSPPMGFDDIARRLGFAPLSASDEAEDSRVALVKLFDAVCAAPDPTGSDRERWKAKGWKVLSQEIETPLRDAWSCVCDEDNFFASRAVAEQDWVKIAKLREPAKLETRVHGRTLAVRFRSVDGNRTTYRVNQELRHEETSL